MNILDQVIKIISSFKPVEIRNEVKKPTISPIVNYKSPSTTIHFNTVNINEQQLQIISKSLNDKLIKAVENQIIGNIATSNRLQKEIAKVPTEHLSQYIKSTISATATIVQVDPNFLSSGGSLFPKPEDFFTIGFEQGSGGQTKIANVKISQTDKKEIRIEYETKRSL